MSYSDYLDKYFIAHQEFFLTIQNIFNDLILTISSYFRGDLIKIPINHPSMQKYILLIKIEKIEDYKQIEILVNYEIIDKDNFVLEANSIKEILVNYDKDYEAFPSIIKENFSLFLKDNAQDFDNFSNVKKSLTHKIESFNVIMRDFSKVLEAFILETGDILEMEYINYSKLSILNNIPISNKGFYLKEIIKDSLQLSFMMNNIERKEVIQIGDYIFNHPLFKDLKIIELEPIFQKIEKTKELLYELYIFKIKNIKFKDNKIVKFEVIIKDDYLKKKYDYKFKINHIYDLKNKQYTLNQIGIPSFSSSHTINVSFKHNSFDDIFKETLSTQGSESNLLFESCNLSPKDIRLESLYYLKNPIILVFDCVVLKGFQLYRDLNLREKLNFKIILRNINNQTFLKILIRNPKNHELSEISKTKRLSELLDYDLYRSSKKTDSFKDYIIFDRVKRDSIQIIELDDSKKISYKDNPFNIEIIQDSYQKLIMYYFIRDDKESFSFNNRYFLSELFFFVFRTDKKLKHYLTSVDTQEMDDLFKKLNNYSEPIYEFGFIFHKNLPKDIISYSEQVINEAYPRFCEREDIKEEIVEEFKRELSAIKFKLDNSPKFDGISTIIYKKDDYTFLIDISYSFLTFPKERLLITYRKGMKSFQVRFKSYNKQNQAIFNALENWTSLDNIYLFISQFCDELYPYEKDVSSSQIEILVDSIIIKGYNIDTKESFERIIKENEPLSKIIFLIDENLKILPSTMNKKIKNIVIVKNLEKNIITKAYINFDSFDIIISINNSFNNYYIHSIDINLKERDLDLSEFYHSLDKLYLQLEDKQGIHDISLKITQENQLLNDILAINDLKELKEIKIDFDYETGVLKYEHYTLLVYLNKVIEINIDDGTSIISNIKVNQINDEKDDYSDVKEISVIFRYIEDDNSLNRIYYKVKEANPLSYSFLKEKGDLRRLSVMKSLSHLSIEIKRTRLILQRGEIYNLFLNGKQEKNVKIVNFFEGSIDLPETSEELSDFDLFSIETQSLVGGEKGMIDISDILALEQQIEKEPKNSEYHKFIKGIGKVKVIQEETNKDVEDYKREYPDKSPIWRGKETKEFIDWKEKRNQLKEWEEFWNSLDPQKRYIILKENLKMTEKTYNEESEKDWENMGKKTMLIANADLDKYKKKFETDIELKESPIEEEEFVVSEFSTEIEQEPIKEEEIFIALQRQIEESNKKIQDIRESIRNPDPLSSETEKMKLERIDHEKKSIAPYEAKLKRLSKEYKKLKEKFERKGIKSIEEKDLGEDIEEEFVISEFSTESEQPLEEEGFEASFEEEDIPEFISEIQQESIEEEELEKERKEEDKTVLEKYIVISSENEKWTITPLDRSFNNDEIDFYEKLNTYLPKVYLDPSSEKDKYIFYVSKDTYIEFLKRIENYYELMEEIWSLY